MMETICETLDKAHSSKFCGFNLWHNSGSMNFDLETCKFDCFVIKSFIRVIRYHVYKDILEASQHKNGNCAHLFAGVSSIVIERTTGLAFCPCLFLFSLLFIS